jgi:hypothetical protein
MDKIDLRELQANLSAMLYIVTEQQSMIAELLSVLLESGVLTHEALVRVSAAKKDRTLTEPVYEEIYKSFVTYFLKTKWVLMTPEEKAETAQQLGLNTPAAENLPNEDSPDVE